MQIINAEAHHAEALAKFASKRFCDIFAHLYAPECLDGFLKESYSLQKFLYNIENYFLKIAIDENKNIIGYVMGGAMTLPFEAEPNAFEMYRLYIAENMTGTGLGKKLYESLLDFAKKIGASELYLGVFNQNHRAIKFYTKMGFEIVGQYYYKVGKTLDDERIMRLKLV